MARPISNSKRLWITIGVTTVNIATLIVSIVYDKDPVSVATALAIVNAPVYAYLGMETLKPSKKQNESES